MSESRIEQLWESSKAVLADCALPNGAIVAANSDMPIYPETAENYRYVWMRDNAYQLEAAFVAGVPDAEARRNRYLKWLWDRGQQFSKTGVVVKRYATNGALDVRYGTEYQPDQAGAMLWTLTNERQSTYDNSLVDETVRKLANGLVSMWQENHFKVPTQDLWENRLTDPSKGDSFTYTVAACAHGLTRATDRWVGRTYEADLWAEAADQMDQLLEQDPAPYFQRKIYARPDLLDQDDPDNGIDASLNALVYPFFDRDVAQAEDWRKRDATTAKVNSDLLILPQGAERFVRDSYDGIARPDGREFQAGRWPLLTFGHAVALDNLGYTDQGQDTFHQQVDYLDRLYEQRRLYNNHIPEQVFFDNERQGAGVTPLGWSHAAFIISAAELKIVQP